MKSRNKELLDRFVAFCEEHSEMRFWQALLAFVNLEYPYAEAILFYQEGRYKDTFYLEGLDK